MLQDNSTELYLQTSITDFMVTYVCILDILTLNDIFIHQNQQLTFTHETQYRYLLTILSLL